MGFTENHGMKWVADQTEGEKITTNFKSLSQGDVCSPQHAVKHLYSE